MSLLTVVIYVTVTTAAVLFSGGTALETIFGISLARGGLESSRGIAILYAPGAACWPRSGPTSSRARRCSSGVSSRSRSGCGRWAAPSAFFQASADRLHMILPASHPELPWTVLIGGMWIPIFYYCGLNQFIVQRTLAARSLKQGQLGDRLRRGPVAPHPLRHRDAGGDGGASSTATGSRGPTRPTPRSSASSCRRG